MFAVRGYWAVSCLCAAWHARPSGPTPIATARPPSACPFTCTSHSGPARARAQQPPTFHARINEHAKNASVGRHPSLPFHPSHPTRAYAQVPKGAATARKYPTRWDARGLWVGWIRVPPSPPPPLTPQPPPPVLHALRTPENPEETLEAPSQPWPLKTPKNALTEGSCVLQSKRHPQLLATPTQELHAEAQD